MSFLGEEADGWTMSPKVILLFSVAYMGCVILLHIFGKISQLNVSEAGPTPQAEPEPETPKRFVPNQRVKSDEMTDQEKMDQGFNGSTYTLNGRDVDF